MDQERIDRAYAKVRDALLAERHPDGYWLGELSSSALATATAIGALVLVGRRHGTAEHAKHIDLGINWLIENQNADGGWGDTDRSFSNISTTMLCRAALHLAGRQVEQAESLKKCEAWLAKDYGSTPAQLAEAVRRRYGKDRTFAVPILTMCALAGLVDWREVTRLPFELACLPQSWYRFARLPVVSYALPALIAIGQVVHQQRSTWNPFTAIIRRLARKRSLKVLRKIQPDTGGYLEATPLTSFVTMSLAMLPEDENASQVMAEGVRFIVGSMRPDGSWPIDSNLSVWVTTLAVNALRGDLESIAEPSKLMDWLLNQQGKVRHPFTGAAPGGWGWSHLSGSVPDCDDTPGAILAIVALYQNWKQIWHEEYFERVCQAYDSSRKWIKNLRNADGGWPTFCRGWGRLPFDRSGSDLTAHAIRAMAADSPFYDGWDIFPAPDPNLYNNVFFIASFDFLRKQQRPDGSWLPLWFGNQYCPDDINPVYGTVRVLLAYQHTIPIPPEGCRGIQFLFDNQNEDGGWGGMLGAPSSVEETSLVVDFLCSLNIAVEMQWWIWDRDKEQWLVDVVRLKIALENGIAYLVEAIERGQHEIPTPIGFYFAKLWYYEKLYPLIFAVAALGAARSDTQATE